MASELRLLQRIYRWTPFRTRIAMGLAPGIIDVQVFGENPDVSLQAPEDIWTVGGSIVFPGGAEQLRVSSSSAQDQLLGDGARTMLIRGLDEDHIQILEVFNLSGLSDVFTTQAFLRTTLMAILTAGDTDRNVGTVNVEQMSSGIIMGNILPGKGIAQQAVYTVPAERVLMIRRLAFGIQKQQAVAGKGILSIRVPGGVFLDIQSLPGNSQGSSMSDAHYSPPIAIGEKTDVKVQAVVSGANNPVSGGFSGFIYEDAAGGSELPVVPNSVIDVPVLGLDPSIFRFIVGD